ncbi:hypothetical protein D3C81_1572350 [compost metagenome]
MLERAFAVASAVAEGACIVAARGGQVTHALEQAGGELAAVDLAIAAMPLALTMPLAILEAAGVPAAVGVVDAPFALQQAVNHLAPVTTAVGQARIRWQQRFAIATGSEQQGQGERQPSTHGRIRAKVMPSMPHNGADETAMAGAAWRPPKKDQTKQSESGSAI